MRRINAMGKQILFLLFICSISIVQAEENRVIVGAERTAEYYPLLEGKRVAVFSNHTGMIGNRPVSYTHLRAHETGRNLVCRLLLEKKKKTRTRKKEKNNRITIRVTAKRI